MKHKLLILLALILLGLTVSSPLPVIAAGIAQPEINEGDTFLVGQTYTLAKGETLIGNLVMIGGTLTTEDGSTVQGDIFVMGSTLTLAGKVTGDVTVLGGTGNIAESAQIGGSLISTGGWLYVSPQAEIKGTQSITTPNDRNFDFSQLFDQVPEFQESRNPFSEVLWAVFRTLALAALAALVVLIFPRQSLNAAETVRSSAAVSWLIGFLTFFILPLVLVIMAITIILIPVILFLLFALLAGIIYGYIVIGFEIGRKLEEMVKASWAPPVAAGIGAAILSIVLHAVNLIFCLGFISVSIVVLMAVGVVLLSRFGTRKYPTPPKTFTSSVMPPATPPKPEGNPPEK
jgi:hypothetical protein